VSVPFCDPDDSLLEPIQDEIWDAIELLMNVYVAYVEQSE